MGSDGRPGAKQEMSALITIVIPVYNRAAIVGRTLDSIARQTLRPLEVVLVDNNSTDDSLSVLNQWADRVSSDSLRVKVLSETTPGACAARNAGLATVETPWVMFFDSDDTMTPDHCRLAADAADADADIVGWDINIHLGDGRMRRGVFDATDLPYANLMYGCMATQRYMARTELVRKAGGWSVNVRGWNDVELGMRLCMQSPRIVKCDGTPTVDTWFTEESITGTRFCDDSDKFESSLDRMQSYATPSLARAINLKRMILAGDCAAEGDKETAVRLRRRSLADERSPFYRMLLRAVYAYVSHGGRGTARLLRPCYGIRI